MSVKLRKRMLPSGKVQLYLVTNTSGYRRYEALSMFLTKDRSKNKEIYRLAEAVRAKRELDFHANIQGIAAPWKQDSNFFDYAEGLYRNKTPLTRQTYVNALEQLKSFMGKHLTFREINERLCMDYRDYVLGKLKRNTAATYFARFKSVVRNATKEGYFQRNPAEDLSVHRVDTLPKYLTYEQIIQLTKAECGNLVIREAFLFSLNTGLRFSDVRNLTWAQVREDSIEFTQYKTDSSEHLPLSESAVAILHRRRESNDTPEGQIFPLPRRSTVHKVLNTWAKRAGLSGSISFHRARHSFATLMVTQNVDIYTVSKLLGHKNVATTQIYAKVIDGKKREAINRLPQIGG